jgi:hypothetical protein
MANRENHEKRTNLYDKALYGRDLIQGRDDNAVLGAMGGPVGTFVVPPRVKSSGEGFNILREDSGIKWLPPEEK